MNTHAVSTPQRAGFTLIECLIALAIAAVVASLALPGYQEQIRRGHRADARSTLLRAAHWLERSAVATGGYPDAARMPATLLALQGSTAGTPVASAGHLTVPGARYTLTARSEDGQVFELTATPTAGSAQAPDRCGTLVLDQAGRRGVRGGTASAQDCWTR